MVETATSPGDVTGNVTGAVTGNITQEATQEVIRVMVVDDHDLVRAGVLGLLGGAAGMQVVGECADGCEVWNKAQAAVPHVILMDVKMPIMSGTAATKDLLSRNPNIRVLMLTGSISGRTLDEARQAGAAGYLLKGGNPEDLLRAIRVVAAGGTAWPDAIETIGSAELKEASDNLHR